MIFKKDLKIIKRNDEKKIRLFWINPDWIRFVLIKYENAKKQKTHHPVLVDGEKIEKRNNIMIRYKSRDFLLNHSKLYQL